MRDRAVQLQLIPLKDIVTAKRGLTYNADQLTGGVDGAMAYFNMKSFLKSGGLNSGGMKTFYGHVPAEYLLGGRDVLIANTDVTPNSDIIGSAAVVPTELFGKSTFSHHVTRLTVEDRAVEPRYLARALLLERVRQAMRAESRGTTVKMLDLSGALEIKIGILPQPEQKIVVEILDTLDTTTRLTETVIAKLGRIKKGLLHDLLTRGIDANGELRRPQSQAPNLYKRSSLGWIPVEWDIVTLGQVADIASGVTLGRTVKGIGTVELPYLRVANVQDGYLDLRDIKLVPIFRSELERFRLRVDDVLMNEGGDFDKLGRGAVWSGQIQTCLHQNHVFRVRCNQLILKARYLAALSASALGKTYFVQASKQTTNLASINSTQLKAFPVCLPPLDEQEAIIEQISVLDERVEQEQEKLTKLGQMKSAIMDDLLSGRVRVTPLLEATTE
jgi:type I restriction enzyme S subunit